MSDAVRKTMPANLTPLPLLARETRWASLRQRPMIAWLTGLSGAGKSSIAAHADSVLTGQGRHCMLLDGDNLRLGLNRDLGFTPPERAENVRRAAEAARLMAEAGLVVVVALISPFRAERENARAIAGDVPFLEVFVDTPLATCEARDPKGLYTRARAGLIPDFTGLTSPYEPPLAPDLTIRTEGRDVKASAQALVETMMAMSRAA